MSGIGIGVGYFGSVIAVLVGALILDDHGHAAVFKVIAVLFLLFAIPAFTLVKERPRVAIDAPPPALSRQLPEARRRRGRTPPAYPGVIRFLTGRFFYTDAVNTLIAGFLTIYVKEELGFTSDEVQALLGVADPRGHRRRDSEAGCWWTGSAPRRLLHGVLYLWMVAFALGIAAGASSTWACWVGRSVHWGASPSGGLWAADRVYMARISPPARLGEFYGLYATVGQLRRPSSARCCSV